jgi:hypothetical protein
MLEDLERSFKNPFLSAIYIPPTRQLKCRQDGTDQEPVAPGGGVINRLFHLHNQPPGSDGLELSRRIEDSFEEITDGFSFGVFSEKANNYSVKFSKDKRIWRPAEHCGKGLQDLLIILYFSFPRVANLAD